MPSRTLQVSGAQLTFTQPSRSWPLKRGTKPSSAAAATAHTASKAISNRDFMRQCWRPGGTIAREKILRPRLLDHLHGRPVRQLFRRVQHDTFARGNPAAQDQLVTGGAAHRYRAPLGTPVLNHQDHVSSFLLLDGSPGHFD